MDAFNKLFDAFVDIIVGLVYDRINKRVLKVENDVKELHDAGSALLALNLDDDGFKAKMSDFIDAQIDEWYQEQDGALWTEPDIDSRIDSRIDYAMEHAGYSDRRLAEVAEEAAGEAISKHERDKEHFDYRHEFEEAVDERIKEYLETNLNDEIEKGIDNAGIGMQIKGLGARIEVLEKRGIPEDAATRSQLKALLIAAAGMIDSINAPRATAPVARDDDPVHPQGGK